MSFYFAMLVCKCKTIFLILQYQNITMSKLQKKKTNHEMKEIHNSSQNGKFQNKRRYRYSEADVCVQNDK